MFYGDKFKQLRVKGLAGESTSTYRHHNEGKKILGSKLVGN